METTLPKWWFYGRVFTLGTALLATLNIGSMCGNVYGASQLI